MDRGEGALSELPGTPAEREPELHGHVVPLPIEPEPVAAPTPSTPGRVHALAMAGMSLFAVTGIIATLAFITVAWPGDWGRRVIAVVIACALGFMACASAAILSAARDTYPRRGGTRDHRRAQG